MNTIPCRSCERPNECRRDRHCNRPATLDHAIKEVKDAAAAWEAAGARVQNALAELAAVMLIEKSKGPA